MSDDGSPPPAGIPRIQNAVPDDTIRIMLATDNHIGYMERDPVRGDDSINTFKEILQLAVKHDVDFILLAGDLFHDNKPSRECLYKTIGLLREYTLGDKPVQIELLSDPDEGKAEGFSFPAVNYEDGNFNVGIPVFSIHGNHDDPQGASSSGALCSLDLLSVAGVMNYMGKIDLPMSDIDAATTGIAVRPVLIRKGNTYLGLYGVGNVKDARMHFELRSNRVRMYMPANKEEWFNIFLLHQNRVAHGPQEFVPEGLFDDSIDLVVWGHEHDCRIVPEPVGEKNYFISQPGSSVATSLADGEAIPKHVALLNIQGKEFEMTPIPLRTVRPFVIESIVMQDVAEEEGIDLSDQSAITKCLKAKVRSLIDRANLQWDERNAAAVARGEEEVPRMLPLVRLKVDTTGVTEMSNPVRFGQEFQGHLANPRDVLVFHRARKITKSSKIAIEHPELSLDDPDASISERIAKVRVGSLVKQYLEAQELQLLGETGMSEAIRMFVEKDEIHAIQTHVTRTLTNLAKGVQQNGSLDDDDEFDEALDKAKEHQEKVDAENIEKRKTKESKGKEKAAVSDAESVDSMAMDVDIAQDLSDDEDMPPPPPPKKGKAPAKKAPAKAAAKPAAKPKKAPAKRKKAVDSDEEAEVIEIPDDDDDDIEEDEPPKPVKRTNRAAVLSQNPAPKKAPAKKKPAQSQLSFAPASSSRPAGRAAASRAKGKMVVDEDSD